jgi:hypothetical protein
VNGLGAVGGPPSAADRTASGSAARLDPVHDAGSPVGHEQAANEHVDLDKAVVKFPVTKTSAFTMPISTFMVDLLRNRIADNAKEFGDDCKWVFPSATSETGHLAEAKLTRAEAKLFKNSWSAHVLRHSWITNANEKVGISDHHQRLLTNHAPKRGKRRCLQAGAAPGMARRGHREGQDHAVCGNLSDDGPHRVSAGSAERRFGQFPAG